MSETPPDWAAGVGHPGVHPSATEQTQPTRPQLQFNLFTFAAQLIEYILGYVVIALTGGLTAGVSAFAQLTNWAVSLLPALILAPLQSLVALLQTLFGWIPGVGTVIEQIAAFFGLINTTASNAITGVAVLTMQINGGTVDTFDRAASFDLGTDYTQIYLIGGSGGALGTDGNGNAHWYTAGSGGQSCLVRRNTTFDTDYQMTQLQLANPPANASADAVIAYLRLRIDAAQTSDVEVRIFLGTVEIGTTVSGTYTRFGAVETVTQGASDLYEFRAGTAADIRQFVLLLNNQVVCVRTDTGAISQVGPSYRYPGFAGHAGSTFFFPIGFAQIGPPDVQAFGFTDLAP